MDAAYLQNVSRLRAVAQALKEFARLLKLEQEEDHREISIDELRDPFFDFFLRKTPVDTLGSFGLQNGMKHPNFAAVHCLLKKRFKFNKDDAPE